MLLACSLGSSDSSEMPTRGGCRIDLLLERSLRVAEYDGFGRGLLEMLKCIWGLPRNRGPVSGCA